jgi:dTDP-4-amino-4,6-dideoxygalactose transaminase
MLPFTRPTIDEATIAEVAQVLRSGWITSGPQVKAFEAELSAHFGGRPVRVFNSGTCTMEIALRIAGIGAGDEVITTPLSWVATANVILETGAKPVFADIDPVTRNIDLERAARAVTGATRAILPVDLSGLPVDRTKLYAFAESHKLRIVEDAAQSFGSSWAGRPIGSTGDFVSISFHANKNITSIEGGCLIMNNEAEAKLAEQYRLQGVIRSGRDGMDVDLIGGKYNLTDVAACVGRAQLKQFATFRERRRRLARQYFDAFHAVEERLYGLQLPLADFDNTNWHMFQVVLPEEALKVSRKDIMAGLEARGIMVGVHYPAIHLFTLYRKLGWQPGDFPHAEYVGRNTMSLPLFPSMADEDVNRTVTALVETLEENAR